MGINPSGKQIREDVEFMRKMGLGEEIASTPDDAGDELGEERQMTPDEKKRHIERLKQQHGDDYPVKYQRHVKKHQPIYNDEFGAEKDLTAHHGDTSWFAKMSPKAQKEYLKLHPNSTLGGNDD